MDKPRWFIAELRKRLRERGMDDHVDVEWDRASHRYALLSWNRLTQTWMHALFFENPETFEMRPVDSTAFGWLIEELQSRERFAARFRNDNEFIDFFSTKARKDKAYAANVRKEKAREERLHFYHTCGALKGRVTTCMAPG